MFENLITDRTIADFLRWQELRNKGFDNMTEEEKAEWSSDMKGAYNASDLNRVGTVLNYLLSRLKEVGYLKGNEFNMDTLWTSSDIPATVDFLNYLQAVQTIKNSIATFRTTPEAPPIVNRLNYNEANNIEKILIDINILINNMLLARNYCGELYSGEI